MIPDKGALKKLLDSNSSTRYKNSTPPAISSIRSTASSPPPPPHLTVAELDGYSSVSRSTQSHQTQFNNYLLNSNSNFNSTKISSSQFKLKESISKLSGDDLEAEFHLNQNISTSNKESGMKDEGVRRDTDVWKELQQTLDEEKNNSQIHSCSNSNIHQRSQKSLKSSSETYSSLFHQKFDDNSSRTTNFYRPILPHSSPANFNSPIHPSFSKRPDSSVSSVEYWSRSAQSNIDHRPESLTCFISPQVTPEASRQSDVDHYHYSSNSSNYHLLNLSVPALYSPSPPPPISRKKSYSQQNHSSYSNSPEHYLPKPIWDYPSSPSPSSSSVTSFSTTSTGGTRANRTSMESTRSELLTFENDSFGEYIKRFGEEMENDYRSFNNLRGSQTHIASQRMELDSIAGNQVAISIKGKVVLKSEVAESGNLEVAPVKSRALKEKRVYTCPISSCGKSFVRPSALETHNRSHNGYRPFACPLITCSRPFSVFSNLKRHMLTHPEIDFKSVSMSDLPQFMIDSRASQLAISASKNGLNVVGGEVCRKEREMVWINQTPGFEYQ